MSMNRVDTEWSTFLEGQRRFEADPHAKSGVEIESNSMLRDFVDPLRLSNQLDRIAEFRFEGDMREYLHMTAGLSEAYIAYLDAVQPPTIKVLQKDKDIRVRLVGPAVTMPWWETAVVTRIRDLYYKGIAEDNLQPNQEAILDALQMEGMRRLQTKGDMLRNSGVRFVEAGTKFRYSFQWQAVVLQVVVGDMGDLIQGTTNVNMALAFGLPLRADEDARRVHAPSIREAEKLLAKDQTPLRVTGANAFQMAHLYDHLGDQVTFDWDRDLMGDMGPSGRFLPLTIRELPTSV